MTLPNAWPFEIEPRRAATRFHAAKCTANGWTAPITAYVLMGALAPPVQAHAPAAQLPRLPHTSKNSGKLFDTHAQSSIVTSPPPSPAIAKLIAIRWSS